LFWVVGWVAAIILSICAFAKEGSDLLQNIHSRWISAHAMGVLATGSAHTRPSRPTIAIKLISSAYLCGGGEKKKKDTENSWLTKLLRSSHSLHVWFMWPLECHTLPSFTYIFVISHNRQLLCFSLFIVFYEQSWKWSTCGLQFNANVQGNAKDVSKKFWTGMWLKLWTGTRKLNRRGKCKTL
jgi:hypothetical protein